MKTGIYFLIKNRIVVYIGRTKNWPLRLSGHGGIDFTDAKLFECKESDLIAYEARLIKIFKPKHNISGSSNPSRKRLTNDWIVNNIDLIKKSKTKVNNSELVLKMRSELGYSPRTASCDIITTLYSRVERLKLLK